MTPPPSSEPGGMATFNIHHAYPEALVRGMRSSFLKDSDYHHLTQCETLDDVRLNLSETDYAEPLADMPTLMPSSLQKVAVDKVRLKHGRIHAKGGQQESRTFSRSTLRRTRYKFYARIQFFPLSFAMIMTFHLPYTC